MLSMCELRRAVGILTSLLSGNVLKRIDPAGPFSLVLTFVGSEKAKTVILMSCDPEYGRVCAAGAEPVGQSSTVSFYEYARAHLPGAVLSGIEIAHANRQVRFEFRSRSDRWSLYLSLLGVRSNLYLVDAGGKLVHCMRPLEETRRNLKVGESWSDPAGSVPSMGSDRWEYTPDDRFLKDVAEAYRQLEIRRNVEALERDIRQALNKERTLLGRKLNHLQEDLARALQAETYRKKGELLKSVLHTVQPGADRVLATDFQSGEEVEIAIDPTLSPSANLEAYFHRYQKDSRGAPMIRQQMGKLEVSLGAIDAIESRLSSALESDPLDIRALEEIASRPFVRRLIGRHGTKRRKAPSPAKAKEKSDIPARLRPKRYRTEDNLEIWVGRSDEGNDYLTTRLARGNDLFFHLEGYPGSHVILRTEGRSDPPSGSILDACELAVHFSKLKNAGSADVHIAPIKNVKKPKGAKPGLVYVRQGKTIRLRRDAGRLQNILASRIDS